MGRVADSSVDLVSTSCTRRSRRPDRPAGRRVLSTLSISCVCWLLAAVRNRRVPRFRIARSSRVNNYSDHCGTLDDRSCLWVYLTSYQEQRLVVNMEFFSVPRKPLPPLMARTRQRMGEFFTSNQVLGRLQTIGCVAVEITQRCNLDCTLCYLSENSQSVRDIPMAEVRRRLDDVIAHFGAGTHVQITGGEPSLRKHTELIEIVRYARSIGLYPALFTNGIAASRDLLARLADVGLCDVAFHVDTTQRRQGFATETELNALRREYIERARGLGLMVIFNTTVHQGNFAELPGLVRFFAKHADVVGLVSFQLQAETGRGEWRARDISINPVTVQNQIEVGAQKELPWGVVQVGHTDCHSYLPALVINERVFPLADDQQLFSDFLGDFDHINWDRHAKPVTIAASLLCAALLRPRWWPRIATVVAKFAKTMAVEIWRSKGRVHKLTFFVQNFMDAEHLQADRIAACSFMVMTAKGPVSMCKHNARRDEYILQPFTISDGDGRSVVYEPLKKTSQSRKRFRSIRDAENHPPTTV